MPGVCVFCDQQPDKWSEEHAIPQWLLDHMGITAQDQTFQGYAVSGGQVTKQRIFATRRLVEGRVCALCNNGWMSELENAAKPVLIPLIEQKRAVWELTVDESIVIAKWAVKSAYVLANVSLASAPAPTGHLWQLCGGTGTIPAGVHVFGFQIGFDQNISFLQIPSWPQLLQDRQAAQPVEGIPGAYKIGWQFRNLMLLVAHYSPPPVELIPVAGLHVPIWPAAKLLWPAYRSWQLPPFTSSLPILKSFAESVGVFVPPAAANINGASRPRV
jgi:hypothetical protein